MDQGNCGSAPHSHYSVPHATTAPPPPSTADHLPNPYPFFSMNRNPPSNYFANYPQNTAPLFSMTHNPSSNNLANYPQTTAPLTGLPYAPSPALATASISAPPNLTYATPLSHPLSYGARSPYLLPQRPYYSAVDHYRTALYHAPPPLNPCALPALDPPYWYPYMYSAINGIAASPAKPLYDYSDDHDEDGDYDCGEGYDYDYNEGYGNFDLHGDGDAYEGSKTQPRGTAHYGSPVGFPDSSTATPAKIGRAVPVVETEQDLQGGVHKFRVKLLAESHGQSTMDVLCQVGLDGIQMLDPSTNRALSIYPLNGITRFEVTDSSTFAFWYESSVDLQPRQIKLQSNSHTTNSILDTLIAATVQFKEMGGKSVKIPEQPTERKKGLAYWMSMIKPVKEEKDHWVPDEAVTKCSGCSADFGAFVRKHHCRKCGNIFCDKCSHGRFALTADKNAQPVRVCDLCLAEEKQRLKEGAAKPGGLQGHNDLAKKLRDEMERIRKSSSAAGKDLREVACPTCTGLLQLQVPSSGAETVECGVCHRPFFWIVWSAVKPQN